MVRSMRARSKSGDYHEEEPGFCSMRRRSQTGKKDEGGGVRLVKKHEEEEPVW